MIEFEYIKDIVIKNKFAILGFLFGIISIIGSVYYVRLSTAQDSVFNETESSDVAVLNNEEKEQVVKKSINVDVKGAVKKPGVYAMDENSCVFDAITKAGGLNSKGSTTNLNLSRKLKDEMVIYVFTKDEIKKREAKNELICEVPKCECEVVDKSFCDTYVDNGNNSDSSNNSNNSNNQSDSNKNEDIKKVSLNKGTKEDFLTLDGIGESKALAIIAYREENGFFEKVEDIMNVSGIGEKAFEKIKDKLTL